MVVIWGLRIGPRKEVGSSVWEQRLYKGKTNLCHRKYGCIVSPVKKGSSGPHSTAQEGKHL